MMPIHSLFDRKALRLISYLKGKTRFYKSHCDKIDELTKNYELILGEISDGCFINQEGIIVFANKSFCAMHGFSYNETIGKRCIDLLDTNTRDRTMHQFNNQLKQEIPFARFVYLRQDKKGNKFLTENRAKFIMYNNKPAVLGLCTDVTEEMEIEEKERQKKSLIMIGRLTASIAHEIRNRLSAINIDLQILQDKLELDGNNRRRLEIVHEQFNHLGVFVSRLMELACPLKLQYDSVLIDNLLNELIVSLRYRIVKEGTTLITRISPNLPPVTIDQKSILEALENISINALDSLAYENGAKHKFVELGAELTTRGGKQYVDLSVKDNGVGIAPEDRHRIFYAFFTKGKKDGVGLGLCIVKRIINAHKGFVIVETEIKKGTCFHLLIPVDHP